MSGWQGFDPSKWAGVSSQGLTALLRNSVQALAREASTTIPNGGRVPVKTGNLGRSVMVSDKAPNVDAPNVEYDAQRDISSGIAAIQPGKDVFIGWTPVYARRMNYGFVGTDSLGRTYAQAGFGFAEAAAAKWPEIVIREAGKIRSRGAK